MSAGADNPAEIIVRWSMGKPLFYTDPSSDSDTAGGRSIIIKSANGFTAKNDQDSKQYGNIDFLSVTGARLTFWGPVQRYHSYNMYQSDASGFGTLSKHGAIYQQRNATPAWLKYWRVSGSDSGTSTALFNPAIYYRGELIKNAPYRVMGTGLAIDPEDSSNIYLIAICGDDPADSGHSSPGTSVYAAAWNNGSPGSFGSALDTQAYAGTNTQGGSPSVSREWTQNLDPWHGDENGLNYRSFRYDDGTNLTRGVHVMSVTITFTAGVPSATIASEGLAWSSAPEIQAIDYVGTTQVRLEDDLTTIYWTNGTDSYDVLTSGERSPSGTNPSYLILAADLRARSFLLQKNIKDGGGVTIDREIIARVVIDGSTVVDNVISTTV